MARLEDALLVRAVKRRDISEQEANNTSLFIHVTGLQRTEQNQAVIGGDPTGRIKLAVGVVATSAAARAEHHPVEE